MDVIFDPLEFRNLTVKNRIFRSNISGRFDNYDGSGNQATLFDPTAAVVASRPRRGARIYTAPSNLVTLAGAGTAGGGQAHENMQPFLTVNFAIALTGVFPPRN